MCCKSSSGCKTHAEHSAVLLLLDGDAPRMQNLECYLFTPVLCVLGVCQVRKGRQGRADSQERGGGQGGHRRPEAGKHTLTWGHWGRGGGLMVCIGLIC